MEQPKYVSWKVIAPIIADVLISPWNLLIGGLLISRLNLPTAVIAIVIGYIILGFIFYIYGGLGFKLRLKTSELIEPVFGEKGTRVFFSAILAMGQIGWFAIINQIGGESLAKMFNLPSYAGIIVYALAMFLMANLSLFKLAITKVLITASSIALIIYLLSNSSANLSGLTGEAIIWKDMLWGVSIVVASLISFSSVTPDFFAELKTRKDSVITVMIGLIIPGIAIATIGALLFARSTTLLSVSLLIGITGVPFIGHLFSVVTNTDAAIAIYTPGNRLQYMFKIPFAWAVGIATAAGTLLSLLNIVSFLESWLAILAAIYPAIIGITLAHYLLKHYAAKQGKKTAVGEWKAIVIIAVTSLLIFIIDISLLNWIVGLTAFLLYILMSGVTITINVGQDI